MIANGGTINCSGKCNKINLTMGGYLMNSPMIAIPMGGADVVLGIQWLQSLRTIAFNFQELFMKFSLEGKEIELRGITGKPNKVISSNGMNSIFKTFLQKFVLVFFDDILIYSKSWEDHMRHVDKVLQLLKEQQLYAKPSKCFFEVKEVQYLGHIASHEGVKVDPNKIKAMMDWSIPKTLKNLRGFWV
jgi:hypothetical protein